MVEVGEIKIQFDYSSPESEDILRCLRTLYATEAGSQPMDRGFGLNWGFIDKPMPVAQQEYALEVIRKTKEYEPRVTVEEVAYEFDGKTGKMNPVIKVRKGDAG